LSPAVCSRLDEARSYQSLVDVRKVTLRAYSPQTRGLFSTSLQSNPRQATMSGMGRKHVLASQENRHSVA